MKKVVFLTMDNLDGFVCYDDLLIEPLNKLGWTVEKISWRKANINWNEFNAVIVRSTWDYQTDYLKFLKVLDEIDRSDTRLENSLPVLKWNMNKSYLRDLEKAGILIPQTIWEKNFDAKVANKYFELLNTDEIIIKPNISGNADDTFRIMRDNINNHIPHLERIFQNREFMVQPFKENILDEGEYSLFYFGGEFSHAILKKPKEKDFRVQEEHGGILKSISPSVHQLETAKNILNKIEPLPLYARIDLIRTTDNEFELMELELIEPSLYFNMDSESPMRFAQIFNDWISGSGNR
jgi:hypothetical protein